MRKKQMWKLLLLLMAILVMGIWILPHNCVRAEEDDDPSSYPPYETGSTVEVTDLKFDQPCVIEDGSYECRWFSYTPEKDENVCLIYSISDDFLNSGNIGIGVFESTGKECECMDTDDEDEGWISTRCKLTAGKKYYISVYSVHSEYTLTVKNEKKIKSLAFTTPENRSFMSQLETCYAYGSKMTIAYQDGSSKEISLDNIYGASCYNDLFGNRVQFHIKGIDKDNSNIDKSFFYPMLPEGLYRVYATWGDDSEYSVDCFDITIISRDGVQQVDTGAITVTPGPAAGRCKWYKFQSPAYGRLDISDGCNVKVYEEKEGTLEAITYDDEDEARVAEGHIYYIGFWLSDFEDNTINIYLNVIEDKKVKCIKNIQPVKTTFAAGVDKYFTDRTNITIEYEDGTTYDTNITDYECRDWHTDVMVYAKVRGTDGNNDVSISDVINEPGTYDIYFMVNGSEVESEKYQIDVKSLDDMDLPELNEGECTIDTTSAWQEARKWYKFAPKSSGEYTFSSMPTALTDDADAQYLNVYTLTNGVPKRIQAGGKSIQVIKNTTYYLGIYGSPDSEWEQDTPGKWTTDLYNGQTVASVSSVEIASMRKRIFAENIENNFLEGAQILAKFDDGESDQFSYYSAEGLYRVGYDVLNSICVVSEDDNSRYDLMDTLPAGKYKICFVWEDGREMIADNGEFEVKSLDQMELKELADYSNSFNIYIGAQPDDPDQDEGIYYWSDLYKYTAELDGHCRTGGWFDTDDDDEVSLDVAQVYEINNGELKKLELKKTDYNEFAFDVEKGHTYYVRYGKYYDCYSDEYGIGVKYGTVINEIYRVITSFDIVEKTTHFDSMPEGNYAEVTLKCIYDDGTTEMLHPYFDWDTTSWEKYGNEFSYVIIDKNGNDITDRYTMYGDGPETLPDGIYKIRVSCNAADYTRLPDVEYEIYMGNYSDVPVNKIVCDKAEINAYVGDQVNVTATVEPSNAADPSVTWSSSDEGVAIADDDGRVFCVGAGTAIITATANDGSGVSISIKATVRRRTAKFNKVAQINKKVGDKTFALGAELLEGDGALSYRSSNTNVVIVDRDGKVTVRGAGTATITVTSAQTRSYEKAEMSLTIKVQKPDPVDLSAKSAKTTVSGIAGGKFTGNSVTQSKLTVKAGGKTLTKDKDYRVAYKNNKNVGKATITITGIGSYKGTVTRSFNIAISKGSTYTVGKLKYKVTNAATNGKGTVTVTGTTYKTGYKSFKTLDIKKTVSIGGVTYKVTAVGRNAFKGYKYLGKVTVGANVTTIGAGAFSGCSSLKTVTISTTQLTTKTVGAKAFSGINAKAAVKVPAKKLAAYKKLLKQKGLPAKATVKK